MAEKRCPSCKELCGGGPVCAECDEKRRFGGESTRRLSTRGRYGYRLRNGFNRMNYIDDEYVEPRSPEVERENRHRRRGKWWLSGI